MGRILVLALFVYASAVAADQSTCYGTTANGRLENGVKLPAEGEKFVGYSVLAATLGRTYLHATARDIVLDAYKSLEQSVPGPAFVPGHIRSGDGGLQDVPPTRYHSGIL
jgi:penicillin-insensitive murein endopeptidase